MRSAPSGYSNQTLRFLSHGVRPEKDVQTQNRPRKKAEEKSPPKSRQSFASSLAVRRQPQEGKRRECICSQIPSLANRKQANRLSERRWNNQRPPKDDSQRVSHGSHHAKHVVIRLTDSTSSSQKPPANGAAKPKRPARAKRARAAFTCACNHERRNVKQDVRRRAC